MNLTSLNKQYNMNTLGAFIIYLPNNINSVSLAKRCLNSCQQVKQNASLYEGFDGTSGEILIPDHLKNQSWIKWIKITDQFQSVTEIACSLSHISLWVKCMEEDRPIVILEHDAIMVKPYNFHHFYNAVSYLGCHEQLEKTNLPITPIYSSINRNWNFIHRAHAYSIDPPVAKKLFINVLDRGIFESADVMIKCDDVAIIQHDFYAYDKSENFSTITNRKTSEDNRRRS